MTTSDKIDWRAEQDRFLEMAYTRTLGAARRAFKRWPERKRDDAVQEALGKMWYQWRCCLEKGKDPAEMIGPLIHWAIMHVRYDRKIAGRARGIDVFDYRAKLSRQDLDGQGKAHPSERSARINDWIDWGLNQGDDPAEMVAAMEAHGLSYAAYADAA